MFESTKKVIDTYNALSAIGRRRYLNNAPTAELEILSDYADKITPPVETERSTFNFAPNNFNIGEENNE